MWLSVSPAETASTLHGHQDSSPYWNRLPGWLSGRLAEAARIPPAGRSGLEPGVLPSNGNRHPTMAELMLLLSMCFELFALCSAVASLRCCRRERRQTNLGLLLLFATAIAYDAVEAFAPRERHCPPSNRVLPAVLIRFSAFGPRTLGPGGDGRRMRSAVSVCSA